jgi:copper chaperone NosL
MKKKIGRASIWILMTGVVLCFCGTVFSAQKMKPMGKMLTDAPQKDLEHMQVQPDNDMEKFGNCSYCGMDRKKFNFSRVVVSYDDGSSSGACSLRCAAVDIASRMDRVFLKIWVADYYSKKLIDAEKAAWVIHEDKPGVMTRRAKWAFKTTQDAGQYIKVNGGKIATFDEVMLAAYQDMYDDSKMIREKRKKMHMHEMNRCGGRRLQEKKNMKP